MKLIKLSSKILKFTFENLEIYFSWKTSIIELVENFLELSFFHLNLLYPISLSKQSSAELDFLWFLFNLISFFDVCIQTLKKIFSSLIKSYFALINWKDILHQMHCKFLHLKMKSSFIYCKVLHLKKGNAGKLMKCLKIENFSLFIYFFPMREICIN